MQGIGHGGNVPSDKTAVFQFTEDLVGSVVHVLNYRQELRGWTQKKAPGSPTSVQVLAVFILVVPLAGPVLPRPLSRGF